MMKKHLIYVGTIAAFLLMGASCETNPTSYREGPSGLEDRYGWAIIEDNPWYGKRDVVYRRFEVSGRTVDCLIVGSKHFDCDWDVDSHPR